MHVLGKKMHGRDVKYINYNSAFLLIHSTHLVS